MESTAVAALVRRAHEGDNDAWETLVSEYSDLLWGVARRFRMSEEQRADAVQNTWLALLENLERVRQPERLPGWLATTARRCCLAALDEHGRENTVEFFSDYLDATHERFRESDHVSPEHMAVRREHHALVHRALAELSPQHRRLIDVLFSAPSPRYRDVVEELGMPHGSIGPTRARMLKRMRVMLEAAGLQDVALS